MMDQSDNFFENVYQNADKNDLSSIPWATLKPNRHLEAYLKKHETVQSKSALVIGCGLGDDAHALAEAGYSVDAIDISQTAISIAKERFGSEDIAFCIEDIFFLPKEMSGKYDLVFESRTIQSLHPEHKKQLMQIIAGLLAPQGELLLHANIQDDVHSFCGPPWPLYRSDLQVFKEHDLEVIQQDEIVIDKPIAPYEIVVHYRKSMNKK